MSVHKLVQSCLVNLIGHSSSLVCLQVFHIEKTLRSFLITMDAEKVLFCARNGQDRPEQFTLSQSVLAKLVN